MKRAYISLGSNLGNRTGTLRKALAELTATGIEVVRVSEFYKTEPVDFSPQRWFVNCAAEVSTNLMPLQFLKTLKSIERKLGRRVGVAKGPRPIDLDILLFENSVIRSSALTVPHAKLPERRFVLVPLCEIAPRVRHPVTQKTVLDMLRETIDGSQVVRLRESR